MLSFLDRGNDLQEFFWPLIHYSKNQILNDHTFPLWNPMFISGTPLATDPQAPIFYMPNIIFLFVPIDAGFALSILGHMLLGAIGSYLLAESLQFSKKASVFIAILFMIAPSYAGYIEAGHFGLIQAFGWIPIVFLSTAKMIKSKNVSWVIILAISLAMIFFTHLPTFLAISISVAAVILLSKSKKIYSYFLLSGIVGFGLTAVALVPQLFWKDQTTRYLLLEKREVFPIWNSKIEFLQAIFLPHFQNISAEKWIPLGIFLPLLALIGFYYLASKYKILIAIVGIVLGAISLNNASPIYNLLIQNDLYVLIRVATRVWPIAFLAAIVLAGLALSKHKGKLVNLLAILAIFELLFISVTHLAKPIAESPKAPESVAQYLSQDEDIFRVYCTTRCFSQKHVAQYELETVGGYSTLQQKNYYEYSWKMMGGYWDYYTLAIPPFGSVKYGDLSPDYTALGEYNTKYIVSPFEINNELLTLNAIIDEFYIYNNTAFKNRVTAGDNKTIIRNIYSPGWRAYLNGKEVEITETKNALMQVDETENVKLVYTPVGFKAGVAITTTTIIGLVLFGIYKIRNEN